MSTLPKECILETPCGYDIVKAYLLTDSGQALFVEDKMIQSSL